MRAGDAVLAGPLVGDALDVLARAVVEEDVVDEAVVVVERHAIAAAGPGHVLRAVEGAQPDVGVESGLVERRSKVVADEHLERFGIPQGARELLVGEHLVLHVQLVHSDAMLGVGLDVLDEVLGVGLQVLRGLHETAVIVGLRALHPRRRAPRTGEQLHVRLPFLCAVDVRDQGLLVVFDGEMLHPVVAVDLVVAVPVVGEIIGADGGAVEGEVHFVGAEQLLDDLVAFGFADVLQRQPAEFVEAAAEAAQGLVFVAVELQVGRGGGVGGFDVGGSVGKLVVLRRCNPGGHDVPWYRR